MKIVERLTIVGVSGIAIINASAATIGAVWLAIIGQWVLLIQILIAMILSASFVMTLALMPGTVLLVVPAIVFAKKEMYTFVGIFVFLSNLWISAVIAIWCLGSFEIIKSSYDGGDWLPYVLSAYGMATGPWTYRAYASGDNPAGQVAALGSCIGCLSLMGIFLFDPYATGSTIVTAFLVPFIATNLLTIPFHIRQMKLLSTVPL